MEHQRSLTLAFAFLLMVFGLWVWFGDDFDHINAVLKNGVGTLLALLSILVLIRGVDRETSE